MSRGYHPEKGDALARPGAATPRRRAVAAGWPGGQRSCLGSGTYPTSKPDGSSKRAISRPFGYDGQVSEPDR